MNTDQNNSVPRFEATEVAEGKRYRDVPWPQEGRLVFGPWCLLGAWPSVFGLVEEVSEEEKE